MASDHNILLLGNSHTNRLAQFCQHSEDIIIRGIPGASTTNPRKLTNLRMEARQFINTHFQWLALQLGGNECSDVSSRIRLEHHPNNYIITEMISKGTINGFASEDDPLNILRLYTGQLLQSLNNFLQEFVSHLLTIKYETNSDKLCIILPGPRYLKGPATNMIFNLVAYYLSYSLKSNHQSLFKNINMCIIDPFLDDWKAGTNSQNLKLMHNEIEIQQPNIIKSRFGAVHYCATKYSDMYTLIRNTLLKSNVRQQHIKHGEYPSLLDTLQPLHSHVHNTHSTTLPDEDQYVVGQSDTCNITYSGIVKRKPLLHHHTQCI